MICWLDDKRKALKSITTNFFESVRNRKILLLLAFTTTVPPTPSFAPSRPSRLFLLLLQPPYQIQTALAQLDINLK